MWLIFPPSAWEILAQFLKLCGKSYVPGATLLGEARPGNGDNGWKQNSLPEWVKSLLPLSCRRPHTSSPSSQVPCALVEEEMPMGMLWFPGEFSIPLNISGIWHPAHFKSNPKLFIKNQLMFGARDMAMNMSGITSYGDGMRSLQSEIIGENLVKWDISEATRSDPFEWMLGVLPPHGRQGSMYPRAS